MQKIAKVLILPTAERRRRERDGDLHIKQQTHWRTGVPLTFHGVSELTWESTHQRLNYFDRHHI